MNLLRTLVHIIRHPFQQEEAEASARYAETVSDRADDLTARARTQLSRAEWFEGTLFPETPPPRRRCDDE